MKIIKDPVHGYIEVNDSARKILDLPVLQRLRYIRQLGFSYLVYPGANHTRFEHSLGTMHLAGVMGRQLGLSPDDLLLVVITALIHDIGHGPFSHAIEPLMQELTGRTHQDLAWLLNDDSLSGALDEIGISPGDVISLSHGTHPLSGIIHGELDVDRMDYLLRDAHYTGVPYGTVDAQRLIRHTLLADNNLVLHENGINAAESLLIARTLMRPAVYFHHVSRIAEMMFNRALYEHLHNDASMDIPGLLRMDDAACLRMLLSSPAEPTRQLAAGIYYRDLFKRAVYVGRDQVNVARMEGLTSPERQREIAQEIAETAEIPVHEVMVDIPPFPHAMSVHVQVKNRHRVISLEEVSPLTHTLNETRCGQWRIGVYTLPRHVEKISSIARGLLHVRPLTTQDRLRI